SYLLPLVQPFWRYQQLENDSVHLQLMALLVGQSFFGNLFVILLDDSDKSLKFSLEQFVPDGVTLAFRSLGLNGHVEFLQLALLISPICKSTNWCKRFTMI